MARHYYYHQEIEHSRHLHEDPVPVVLRNLLAFALCLLLSLFFSPVSIVYPILVLET